MNFFHILIISLTGFYLLVGSLLMTTKDLLSSLLFKVIPFFLGFFCLILAGKLIGWL